LAEQGEKEAVPKIQTEMMQVLGKEKVQEIVLEKELKVQDIVQGKGSGNSYGKDT
jgi:hypothetical protein